MKIVRKSNYKPRFRFYYQITGIVLIIDGIINIFSGIFGYYSDLYSSYCLWNIKEDIKRRKELKEKK